jgi:hypothetical protein
MGWRFVDHYVILVLKYPIWNHLDPFQMGFFSTIFGFFGFGVGISIGLVVGYFLFIYFQPTDVEVIILNLEI